MSGGAGNDTYFVDNAADLTIELLGEGVDTVKATVSYTLAANVDNITLQGAAAIDATGNDLVNVMVGTTGGILSGLGGNDNILGGSGNDILSGGLGKDKLTGGAGADAFVFDAALGVTNTDTIKDFSVVDDFNLARQRRIRSARSSRCADPGMLRVGAGATTALDANDHLIYNTTNGALFYDADGAGARCSIFYPAYREFGADKWRLPGDLTIPGGAEPARRWTSTKCLVRRRVSLSKDPAEGFIDAFIFICRSHSPPADINRIAFGSIFGGNRSRNGSPRGQAARATSRGSSWTLRVIQRVRCHATCSSTGPSVGNSELREARARLSLPRSGSCIAYAWPKRQLLATLVGPAPSAIAQRGPRQSLARASHEAAHRQRRIQL